MNKTIQKKKSSVKFVGDFEIWFENTGFSEPRTIVTVSNWGTDYWRIDVPIGDDDSSTNLALRATLEFIEEHWGGTVILSSLTSVILNKLIITVKSVANPLHKKSYKLKYRKLS